MKKLFFAIIIFFSVVVLQPTKAVILTPGEYQNLITNGEFAAECEYRVEYAQKARMLEHLRNAYTLSSETTIREVFAQIGEGNVIMRAELNYICRISRGRNELLNNLNCMVEAYYGLTNADRLEDVAITRIRHFLNFQN